jgi:hypothetical protein
MDDQGTGDVARCDHRPLVADPDAHSQRHPILRRSERFADHRFLS